MNKAFLVLADGSIWEGRFFGHHGETGGEVVFNTGLTGYQEVLTDPSYQGQIVVMTYPLIGNYGINSQDFESLIPHVSGFVIKELSRITSNWRSSGSLDDFLKERGIVGIQGLDTRALTKRIREVGAQPGIITPKISDLEKLRNRAKTVPGLVGRDLVREVTCGSTYPWKDGRWSWQMNTTGGSSAAFVCKSSDQSRFRVAVYDFGLKHNILRNLVSAGCEVTVYPAGTPAEEIMAQDPDGIFLSNGPGDPEGAPYAVENVRKLIGRKPLFGICLGHQLIGLALGYKSFKLKFGHHGSNHPVLNLKTGKVEITSQNHGFAIEIPSSSGGNGGGPASVTHINLNDHTLEGLEHKDLPVFSVQYHPEASPGPHDSGYLFQKFVDLMGKRRQ